MGLDRVRAVHARLGAALACPVVTVTGTNGKGSTCAMLEAIFAPAGYRVGLYTSPHLVALQRARAHRRQRRDRRRARSPRSTRSRTRARRRAADGAPTPLTYFEFGTLAALWLFARARLDVVILEVGLGGRLDAVNIVDADVAVVTSIDLDHMDYLGPTREDIGREKAGIFRAGRPAVCAEPRAAAVARRPRGRRSARRSRRSVATTAIVAESAQWQYWGPGGSRYGLPHPALRGAHQLANAATALAALDLMHARLPVSGGAVRDGLAHRRTARTVPGAARATRHRARRRAQSARGARAGGDGRHDGLPRGNARGVRHARRQGHRRRHRGDEGDDRPLVRRDAAGPARRERCGRSRRSSTAPASRRRRSARSTMSPPRCDAARDGAGEADRIIVFGSFLTVAAALAALAPGTAHTLRHG